MILPACLRAYVPDLPNLPAQASCFAVFGYLHPAEDTSGLDGLSRNACTKLALPLAMVSP